MPYAAMTASSRESTESLAIRVICVQRYSSNCALSAASAQQARVSRWGQICTEPGIGDEAVAPRFQNGLYCIVCFDRQQNRLYNGQIANRFLLETYQLRRKDDSDLPRRNQ